MIDVLEHILKVNMSSQNTPPAYLERTNTFDDLDYRARLASFAVDDGLNGRSMQYGKMNSLRSE